MFETCKKKKKALGTYATTVITAKTRASKNQYCLLVMAGFCEPMHLPKTSD